MSVITTIIRTAVALTTVQAIPSKILTAGSSTSFTPVTASGGIGTLSYALTGGTLPTGLTFSTSTGLISGTPSTTLSLTTFTVTVTDQTTPTPQTSAKTFQLTTNAQLTTVQAIPSTTVTVGTAASFTPVTASGGTGTKSFALTGGTLPTGLSFSTSTGLISGTPTTTLTITTFTVTVTDQTTPTPQTSAKTFQLTSNSSAVAAPVITNMRTVASQNTLFNVASGANTRSSHLNVFGSSSNVGATVTVLLGGVTQGTTVTDGSGNWVFALPEDLADAAYVATATVTVAGNTSSPSAAYNFTIIPGLTSLPGAVGSNVFNGDTLSWGGLNFNTNMDTSDSNPNSCRIASTHQLDFTILPDDDWNGSNRTEIEGNQFFGDGSTFNMSYEILFSASSPVSNAYPGGPLGGGPWLVIGQMHDSFPGGQPPFFSNLGSVDGNGPGDGYVVGTVPVGGGSPNFIYDSNSNMARGVWHTVDIIIKPASSGSIAKVWLNGTQIVNTADNPVMHGQPSYYWKMGIYRGPTGTQTQTQLIRYRNFICVMT